MKEQSEISKKPVVMGFRCFFGKKDQIKWSTFSKTGFEAFEDRLNSRPRLRNQVHQFSADLICFKKRVRRSVFNFLTSGSQVWIINDFKPICRMAPFRFGQINKSLFEFL